MGDNSPTVEPLQTTCAAIVTEIAKAVDREPEMLRRILRVPGGPELGRQICIDATEKGGVQNVCRLSILNVDLAPDAEVARIEFEHEKQGKFGPLKIYSVQSIRRRQGQLTLLENFMADKPAAVREADFKPIASAEYAQLIVFKSVQDWTRYRAWQLQEKINV